MTYNQNSIDSVARYVTDLFVQHKSDTSFLAYHNLFHTQNVVRRTHEIAAFYSISGIDLFVVLSAAWFHDCGHLFGSTIDHELRGVLQMKTYMEDLKIEPEVIDRIQSCILATMLPSDPKTLLEKILCDADLYHLGTMDFFVTDMLVKKEFELRNNFVPTNWDETSLSFLKSHVFYTDYCKNLLESRKTKNIIALQNKINR